MWDTPVCSGSCGFGLAVIIILRGKEETRPGNVFSAPPGMLDLYIGHHMRPVLVNPATGLRMASFSFRVRRPDSMHASMHAFNRLLISTVSQASGKVLGGQQNRCLSSSMA